MAQSTKNVAAMSGSEKLGEAIQRSLPLVPAESRIIVEGLLTPESLAVLTTAATACEGVQRMTREQAIGVAQREAKEHGWPWLEPVEARRSRRWFIGPAVWEVASNAQSKGTNVRVHIEDETGRVCRAGYTPR